MSRTRREIVLAAAAAACAAPGRAAELRPRTLHFPRDHGTHPGLRTEWWYATGWLAAADGNAAEPAFGFQLTFFRSRVDATAAAEGRFAAKHLLLAHLALTDLAHGRLRHAERVARWSGDASAAPAAAAEDDTRVHIGRWQLVRESGGAYRAALDDRGAGLALQLALAPTQPLLLQGDAGYSRKGPDARHASHYYSQPQLAAAGTLVLDGHNRRVSGRAWLDHEWSESILPEGAVGWDWIGINLADASALTAFRLRRRDGSAVWAGGSHRDASGALRTFSGEDVRFEPLAWWTSPATAARYPVRWRVHTPAGSVEVRALLDAQELDARASTGTVYWEGLSELLDARGARIGLGYLEMTGYASALRL